MFNKLNSKIQNIISRSKVTAVDVTKKLPRLKLSILSGEDSSAIEYFQHYGFASKPKAGGEAIVIAVGGSRDHLIAIAVEDRLKRYQDLEEGEVALYHPEKQTYIKMKNDGTIEFFGEKISFKNASDDIVDLLSQALDLLSQDVTNTALGPQPLMNASMYAQLKAKIDAFKE